MKFKTFIIPLLAMMLGACGSNNSNENSANLSSINESSFVSSGDTNTSWEPVEPLATGSVSGSLIEIVVGEHLLVDDEYQCSFVPSDCENKTMRAVYDEDIINVTFQPNVPTTFVVHALKPGHAVLKLYSEELDCLVFRNDIVVDEEIGESKIEQYLFNTRKGWVTNPDIASMMGSYKMDFISNAPLTCVMQGEDYEEKTRATLELTYKTMRRNNEFLFYVFDTTLVEDSSTTNKKFREMLVSVTGYSIYAYDNQGLINIFYKA